MTRQSWTSGFLEKLPGENWGILFLYKREQCFHMSPVTGQIRRRRGMYIHGLDEAERRVTLYESVKTQRGARPLLRKSFSRAKKK